MINALSVGAAPEAFQLQRVMDYAACLLDPRALAIHTRVERWAYDEFPLPRQLFEDTLEQLYREGRFLKGTLQVGERRTGIAHLQSPVIAVIDPVGGVVPARSVLEGLEAADKLRVLRVGVAEVFALCGGLHAGLPGLASGYFISSSCMRAEHLRTGA